MILTLDRKQSEILGEILRDTVHQLRIESARTDSHDYREDLHARERIVETLLEELAVNAPV